MRVLKEMWCSWGSRPTAAPAIPASPAEIVETFRPIERKHAISMQNFHLMQTFHVIVACGRRRLAERSARQVFFDPAGAARALVFGSGRFPAQAVVVLAGNCFTITCHTGNTLVRSAATLARLVALSSVS